MIDLKSLTIRNTHDHLKAGDFSVTELVESCLKNIEKENPELNAFLEIFGDWKNQTEEAQELFRSGQADFLTGIPIAVKDNILIEGKICSAGSKILENYHAVYDSTVVSKLKKRKSVLLGRTNMDEFAMGSSTENSAYGLSRNPLDKERVPGGSSGGSAVAVAMNGSLGALGSETAGSVRQPASFCGLVGLKPTYGSVSRYGLIALGSSLDQIGPFAKTVGDIEILFDAIKGHDPLDATTAKVSGSDSLPKDLVIGVPRDILSQPGIDKEVLKNFEESITRLSKLGFTIKDISLPHTAYSLAVYYIIMPAEVSSNLARFDGVKYGLRKEGENLLDEYVKTRTSGFGKEPRRRIILGTYVLSTGYYDAFYNKANLVRNLIINDFEKVFADGVHLVATPTTPTEAFKIGEKANNPLSMYMSDLLTAPANIAGLPAISLPSGFTEKNKMPLGLQFIAPNFREDMLFEAGKRFLGEND